MFELKKVVDSLDPNLAVLSFRHPEKSSTKLGDNTYATFIIHNYTNDIWDNDYVYLGSITEIARSRQGESSSTYPPQMEFSTTIGNKDYQEYHDAVCAAATRKRKVIFEDEDTVSKMCVNARGRSPYPWTRIMVHGARNAKYVKHIK